MPTSEAEYMNATEASPFRSLPKVLRSGAVHITVVKAGFDYRAGSVMGVGLEILDKPEVTVL
jgi:hypothetical protein